MFPDFEVTDRIVLLRRHKGWKGNININKLVASHQQGRTLTSAPDLEPTL